MNSSAFVAASLAFLTAGAAWAQEPATGQIPDPRDSAQERRFDIRLGTGAPMMVSLSIAGRPFEGPLTVDGGLWVFAFMQGGYARVGWTIGLADYRDGAGRGSTLELTPMVGALSGIVAAGTDQVEHFIVPEAVVSFDWTWWFSNHIGLGATLTLGGIFTGAYIDEIDIPAFPDARLAVGVSF
ncbi:MAG TPA: hypothetical protein DFS52_11965 [Myxococcales bacterium]|jgi:hypothetical protein|nr:hypothetical protein [Myxococcales bacterium]